MNSFGYREVNITELTCPPAAAPISGRIRRGSTREDRLCCEISRRPGSGYEPPPVHGEFSGATPSIGVFIAPDGAHPGAIETLCRRSVEGKPAAACADEYMECLKNRGAMRSSNIDKSFAHAYLAAMPNPVARVGEGALGGVWNFESPAFEALSRFLHRLSPEGA